VVDICRHILKLLWTPVTTQPWNKISMIFYEASTTTYRIRDLRFLVMMIQTVTMWVVTLYNLVDGYQHFRRTMKRPLLEATAIFYLAYSLTLTTEATWSSNLLAYFQWTTWHYIPENITFHNHCCEDLKTYTVCILYGPPFWRILTASIFCADNGGSKFF
jgi:hypothetical protein